ncbi:MAG: EF-P lysine aminoacylase EpmA [Desulfobulbaceae bacterium]|nr:EF-P lysine aminoacylase EpmA [Desulfobulbaceae bacterium]
MSRGSRNSLPNIEKERALEPTLKLRARMIQAIRAFFEANGYLHVETPCLIPAPAPEAHIDAIRAGDLYLQPSPELCMKRLLATGFSRIFQISKCFRNKERGTLHLPEFTMLEWYRTDIDYTVLMEECQDLFLFVCESLHLQEPVCYGGRDIDFHPPWERLSVEDAFKSLASIPLKEALEKDLFEEVMVEEIEPHLGWGKPTFLFDYPASMAALARLRKDNRAVAERFEIYVGGLELANGFSELNDAEEQRTRFEEERRKRAASQRPVYPVPEKFLDALPSMPDAAGIALGIDRLAMILTDATSIDQVVAFVPETL